MRMRLNARNRIPHGGMWEVTDPLTGVPVRGTTFDMIHDAVCRERKANGAPIGLGLQEEIENWLCAAKPEECFADDPNMPRKRTLNIGDIVHGTKVMLASIFSGSPLVDQAEADRRASICAGCPFNTYFTKPCAGLCPELRNLVQWIIGSKQTRHDHELRSCSVCGCYTSASVWLPLGVQCVGVTQEQRNQFAVVPNCWKQCP